MPRVFNEEWNMGILISHTEVALCKTAATIKESAKKEIIFKNSFVEASKIVAMKPDVLQWNTIDVLEWLKMTLPAIFEESPQIEDLIIKLNLDGYQLLQMSESLEDEELLRHHL